MTKCKFRCADDDCPALARWLTHLVRFWTSVWLWNMTDQTAFPGEKDVASLLSSALQMEFRSYSDDARVRWRPDADWEAVGPDPTAVI